MSRKLPNPISLIHNDIIAYKNNLGRVLDVCDHMLLHATSLPMFTMNDMMRDNWSTPLSGLTDQSRERVSREKEKVS